MKPQQAGFTLIEVLVAVAVLALALGVFISSGSQYADDARYLQDKTLALWVAQNKLVQYQIAEQAPQTGKSDGHTKLAGRTWKWTSTITDTPDPMLRKVEIRVYRIKPGSHDDAETHSVARLVGYFAVADSGGDLPSINSLPTGALSSQLQ